MEGEKMVRRKIFNESFTSLRDAVLSIHVILCVTTFTNFQK